MASNNLTFRHTNTAPWRKSLLTTVSVFSLCTIAGVAFAQEVIDDGQVIEVTGQSTRDFPSSWTPGSAITVGNNSQGTLKISNGGSVLLDPDAPPVIDPDAPPSVVPDVPPTSNRFVSIAANMGSTGDVIVSGETSTLSFGSRMIVGNAGIGQLTIDGGAKVFGDGPAIDGLVIHSGIGIEAEGSGVATVTGAGSSWTAGEEFTVGGLGSGVLDIKDGGGVVTSKSTIIGEFAGSKGTVTVSGNNSSLAYGGQVYVGREGTGSLTIQDGGSVFAQKPDETNVGSATYIGFAKGSSGDVLISGPNSVWCVPGTTFVGTPGSRPVPTQQSRPT